MATLGRLRLVLSQGVPIDWSRGLIWNLCACIKMFNDTIDDDSVSDASIGDRTGIYYIRVSAYIP